LEVEEEEESASPYSPPMVTPMAQESEQMTLANILCEMEVSRRETFDQLRADRGKVRSSYKSTSKDLSLGKMRGEGRGPLPRILAMVEEEEGTIMMVVEGAINSHKNNLHQSRFQSSRGRMIQTSILSGSKKWTKSSIFI